MEEPEENGGRVRKVGKAPKRKILSIIFNDLDIRLYLFIIILDLGSDGGSDVDNMMNRMKRLSCQTYKTFKVFWMNLWVSQSVSRAFSQTQIMLWLWYLNHIFISNYLWWTTWEKTGEWGQKKRMSCRQSSSKK